MIADLTAQYNNSLYEKGSIKQALELIKSGEMLKIDEDECRKFEIALQQYLHDTDDNTEIAASIQDRYRTYKLKDNDTENS